MPRKSSGTKQKTRRSGFLSVVEVAPVLTLPHVPGGEHSACAVLLDSRCDRGVLTFTERIDQIVVIGRRDVVLPVRRALCERQLSVL